MHGRDIIVVVREGIHRAQVKDAGPKPPEDSIVRSGNKRGLKSILGHQIPSSGHTGFLASVWTPFSLFHLDFGKTALCVPGSLGSCPIRYPSSGSAHHLFSQRRGWVT